MTSSFKLREVPSVWKASMARVSLPRFSTVMPTLVTSLGNWDSARLTAFCRLTRAMSESVPDRKVTEQE